MRKEALCKGCVESVIVSEEVIQELVQDAVLEDPFIAVDELYRERLSICKRCSSLQYGTTCMVNGFIVQYKAKFQMSSCPNPGAPKW